WDQMSVLSELSEIFPLASYTPPKKRSTWKPKLAIAAVTCLLVSVMGLTLLVSPVMDAPTAASYVTAVGEQSTIELEDGSTITLNTNTAISVLYSTTERQINLERGEALFTVESDRTRPFRVYVG